MSNLKSLIRIKISGEICLLTSSSPVIWRFQSLFDKIYIFDSYKKKGFYEEIILISIWKPISIKYFFFRRSHVELTFPKDLLIKKKKKLLQNKSIRSKNDFWLPKTLFDFWIITDNVQTNLFYEITSILFKWTIVLKILIVNRM